MIRYCLVLLVFISLTTGCKDPEQVIFKIYGNVVNSDSGDPVSDVEVSISARLLENGTFTNTFQSVASTSTDSDGYFEFNIEREAYNVLRLEMQKEAYFISEFDISPDDIDPEDGLDVSESLEPVSFVELNLKNISPLSEDDLMEFRYTTAYFPQCSCCNNSVQSFSGMSVDTVVTCPIVGGTQLDYYYTVTKGGGSSSNTGTVFVGSFDTQEIEINY